VVATFADAGRHGLAWVLMITSAQKPPWDGDVAMVRGVLA
jgi:hypothetical protein